MKRIASNYTKVSMPVLIAFLTVMICGATATAGDYSMQKNLKEVADQLARWSKQSSTGKLSPQAQEKLGQLLLETSKLLKEMGTKSSAEMNMEHHKKIEKMKKDWDPFDTSDRM